MSIAEEEAKKISGKKLPSLTIKGDRDEKKNLGWDNCIDVRNGDCGATNDNNNRKC